MKRKKLKRPLSLFLMAALLCSLMEAAAPTASAASFTDVPASHWAHDNIAAASADGVIQGYSNGTFNPSAPVTLAHFVTMMSRAFYAEELNAASSGGTSPWYAGAEAVGDAHDLFWSVNADMPDALSRYDMAAVVFNVLYDLADGWWIADTSIEEVAGSIRDIDSFPSGDIKDIVSLVYKLGILGGYSDGTFRGGVILNRAQAAAVYCRLKEILNTLNEVARDFKNEVLGNLNQKRTEVGLPPLALSDTLTLAARIRARELERSYSHTRPDGDAWDTVLDEVDAEYEVCGEFIHIGADNSMEEEADLLELVLDTDFTQVGIAMAMTLDEEDDDSCFALVFTDGEPNSTADSEQKRQEQQEKERQEQEQKEKERQEQERQEQEQKEKERQEQERQEKERQEQEQKEKERQEQEQKEKERREREQKEKEQQEREQAASLPSTGEIYRSSAYRGTSCSLKIITPKDDDCTFVKIYAVSGSEEIHAVSVFIRPGQTATVKLPSGTYVFKVAYGSGDAWQGEDEMFGSSGSYHRLDNGGTDKFKLSSGTSATLTLMGVANGNVGSRSEPRGSF